jgi:hypothetical protein
LAAMAGRITNALRISPEPQVGLTADRGTIDAPGDEWRRTMFGDVVTKWEETFGPVTRPEQVEEIRR